MRNHPTGLPLEGDITLVPKWRPGGQLMALSVTEMLVAASTFCSLGMVLPQMVKELGWSWSQAGLGFTVMGACCGGSALLPSMLIRRFGVRATLAAGGVLLCAGLFSFFQVHNLLQYFVSAALCGVAYQMMSAIPATFVLTRLFKRRAVALGFYGAVAGLGNVVGPWMALGVLAATDQSWRTYWLFQSVLLLVFGLASAAIVGLDPRFARPARDEAPTPTRAAPVADVRKPARLYRTNQDWTVKQAMRTPQMWVLFAANFANIFALVTVTSLSVGHLTERGVTPTTAGAMLSLEALVAICARLAAGMLGDRFEPRYLLVLALGAMSAGCLMLAFGRSQPFLLFYALGTGIGFGVTALCCMLLLLNYFGQRYNLELISTMALAGAVSALGPAIGGVARDLTGSFAIVFALLAAASGSVAVAAALMRPPRLSRHSHSPASARLATLAPAPAPISAGPGLPDASA